MTPDTSWEREIEEANAHAPRLLEMYKGADIQKCIMIDDLHIKEPITADFVNKIIEKLVVKPDCIYLESSFVLAAADVAASIDPKIAEQTEAEERVWLKKVHDKYNSTNDFLVSWKNSDGTAMFSCPTLVATSYLYRLGLISTEIKPFWGQEIRKSDCLINLLSSSFLQVEANAQLIIKATQPTAISRIEWHFF